MPLPEFTCAPPAVKFLLNDQPVVVADAPPTLTLLNYLRVRAGLCGTKEGCAEGDCGACTVVLAELADNGQRIRYQAINSCIRFLPTVDGKAVITTEALAAGDGTLHPAQQALVDHHGSQCGFCTPGFVMSLFALYQSCQSTDRAAVLSTLSGNLCRCTGYRPILDAATHLFDYPQPLHWGHSDAQSPQRLAALKAITRTTTLTGASYAAPTDMEELAVLRVNHPEARLLAGGTDIGLWVTKLMRDIGPLIYLGAVSELKRIELTDQHLSIGAAVTLSDAWPAILAHYPQLTAQADRFASVPIRNSATLCGNLANGSPIGDTLPAMLALDASLQLRCGSVTRVLPISQFYLGYQQNALAPGEFIAAVQIPLPCPDEHIASYKLSKRYDQDISAVCATLRVRLTAGRVSLVRLAYGGLAATAKRARCAEAALEQQPWTQASIIKACDALADDFQPLSDLRASSAYRLQAARNLLQRFFLQSTGIQTDLHLQPTNLEAL